MKTLFKRLICIVVAVMLCVSSMHIIFTVASGDPQLSSKCETVIELNGKDATFGSAASDLRINTRIKYDSAVDLSGADKLELSVYVENADALKSAIVDGQKFCLGFSSSKLKETMAHSEADISAQIIQNGWNTVAVNISDFEGTVNWSGIRYIFLRFSDESVDLPAALLNTEVKFRNVCDTLVIPELTDGDLVIYDGAVIDTLGDDENALINATGDRFTASFEALNAEGLDVIKADLRISDFAAYNAFLNSGVALEISLISENGSIYCDSMDSYTALSEPGWYSVAFSAHGLFAKGDFDIAAVTGVKAEFVGEDGKALGSDYSLGFGIANVRGYKYALKEDTEYYGNVIEDGFNDSREFIMTQNSFSSFGKFFYSSYKALNDAENIEFDFYVNNYEAFKNSFLFDADNNPITASFDIVLEQGENTLVFKGVDKKVVAQGWNHIILPISEAENNGFDLTKEIEGIAYVANTADSSTKTAYKNDFVVIENLVATKGVAAKGETKFDALKEIAEGKSAQLGNNFEGGIITESISADITGTKFVEMDVYVQNLNALKGYMAEKGVTDLQLRLTSTDGADYSVDSVTASILGKLTQNGWNHIAVGYAAFQKGSTTGTFDPAKVTAYTLFFGGTVTAETGDFKGGKIALRNITCSEVKDPTLPENATAVITEEGKSGVYGQNYNWLIDNSRIKLETPVDATKGGSLEFDFYVEDYASFKKMIDAVNTPLYFALGTVEDKFARRAVYEFTDQVTGEGWNHITLNTLGYKANMGDAAPQLEHVYYVFLTFWSESGANAYSNMKFNFKNVCVTPAEYEITPTAPDYDVEITLDGVTHTWGQNLVWIQDRMLKEFSEPVNLTGVDKIELDMYVADYENYKNMIQAASDPLYLCLNTNSNKFQGRALFDIENQITHSGWNHIVLRTKNVITKWGDVARFENVYGMRLHFGNSNAANPCVNDIVRIANLVGSFAEYTKVPALPENVIAQLGNAQDGTDTAGNTVGDYFHYTQDRIYREKMNPVDFSLSPVVEFDIYIEDYDMFLAAQNDPTDGQNSKLHFFVSSTPPALWGQYGNQNRMYYNASINLEPYITHSGWNHVAVGKAEFVTMNHGVDWSALTGYYVNYRGASNFFPYVNANSKLYVKVANIVNTGVVANIPADKDKPLKTDKNAVYISSVEGMSDDYGSWNTLIGEINNKYKTEGKASIIQKNDYTSDKQTAIMYYLLDDTADMSDLKTLKFDFFIDLPQYLNKPTNNIEVLIGNNRFAEKDYYCWNMDLTKLKQGWNEVSLQFKNAKAVGKPDLKTAKVIMLRFTKFDLSAETFEEISYGIDNLRYISATGNKIFRVEGWDDKPIEEEVTDTPEIEDEIIEEDFEIIEDEDVDNVEKVETIVNKTGDVKYNKIVEKNEITDWLVAGIILGVEAAVLAAGIIVFILIHRRKKASK